MTCIIGLVDNNNVYIGGDSAASGASFVQISKIPKVFKRKDETENDEFIFGCTTSFRMIQLLQHQLIIPQYKFNKRDEETVNRYMCTAFIEEVRNLFKKSGFSKNTNDGSDSGGSFLVGFNGFLFEISEDFTVASFRDKFCCTGSGYKYAYGAMMAYDDKEINPYVLTPQQCIEKSLTIASYLSTSVRPPFIILCLKMNSF